MLSKKLVTLTAVCALSLTAITGCGNNNNSAAPAPEPASSSAPASSADPSSTAAQDYKNVDIEVWGTNVGFKPIEKGSQTYEFIKEKLGVGVINPYVEWGGGTNYLNQLNLKIASGEVPDLFLPYGGNEDSLAKNGAIADLTELLPKYAPNVWNNIPEDVWNVVKANDPTGQGKIYYIPQVVDYGRYAGLIRQDWLDKLGLQMPKTQEEYVKVLEAFRDQDPNGNGQKDEQPTGGRQEARWMDHLFAMYGVAMFEGNPDWDIYDGQLTYSAVTPNMRASLEFIAKLYKDGLVDQEALLNDKAKWDGKVSGDKVGNYFQWTEKTNQYLDDMNKNTGVKGEFSVLPILEVPGYEGFYTAKRRIDPQWVVKAGKDETKLLATLTLLNNLYDKDNWKDLYLGVEGMHHTIVDGKAIKLPDDKSTQENVGIFNPASALATLDFTVDLLKSTASSDNMWSVDQTVKDLEDAQQYVKSIAGDGMPSSVYEGFADIQNRTLYIEYATKIIIGQYPIEKFDEFVEKWNKSGGEEVTKRAREWYGAVKK
ncbi:ABC transporter substrate-binding protein [Paenibacillus sp. MMS20-IR301]|uniref:ABC transporter substrate-binding protein n=1 Tax=Paenibacillus sp. MMS20-IR301 TaxID=2895946 RepID=UPI0028ED8A6B|nr:ABC transporter substrate-binding protein [Paenibacillus sp. MMS20-IR301]WNS40773.1 ABC transporter substrate-binding protein [Paenibacillus sp. MMS20-IR301]